MTTELPTIQISCSPSSDLPDDDAPDSAASPDQDASSPSSRRGESCDPSQDTEAEPHRLPTEPQGPDAPPPPAEGSIDRNGLPTPPDGGWGWMVVFGSFMIHVIADGVAYSFGVFLEDFTDYFDTGYGSTSLLGSLMIGVTWGSGPIVSALTNMFGCRAVTVAGSVVAAFGFVISIFAPNIIFMYFSFGIVAGFGLGLIYVPAIVSVTFYFEKRRSFATGLAVCGSGIGTFIFGPLTEVLLNYYGSWKAAVLIEAALLLNCILCGALFRPLEHPKTKAVPLADQAAEDNVDKMYPPVINGTVSTTALSDTCDIKPSPLRRTPSTSSLPHHAMVLRQTSADPKTSLNIQHDAQNFSSDFWIHKAHLQPGGGATSRHSKKSSTHLSPLVRKDIFYSGSLKNIPLYTADHAQYTRSIASIPDTTRDDSDSSASSKTCCQALRDKLSCTNMHCKDILDFSVLKDSIFILFVISNVLTSLGFCVPYTFLPDRAKLLGCSRREGAFLISIIGISNTVGRVVFGFISDRKGVNRLMLYSSVLVLCGLSTIGSSLCVNYALLCLYAALFGCFLGVYVSITSVVLVDLLGLDKLTSSFGLVLFFQGVAAVLGPPIAGYVYDATDDYNISFYLMGTMIALSGVMLYPIPLLQRRQQRRQDAMTIEHEVQLGKHNSRDGHKKAIVMDTYEEVKV